MCTWFYADYKTLENYITRAQKSPPANEIMLTISRITTMTGDIRPTDITAAIDSGRSGNCQEHSRPDAADVKTRRYVLSQAPAV